MRFSSELKRVSRPSELVVVLIMIAVMYLAMGTAFYFRVASQAPGANDYYSRWVGARLLFQQGVDPYSDSVTRQIQLGMFGHLVPAQEDQVAFAYPLYAVFYTLPFVWFPYPLAESFWIALLVLLVSGGTIAVAIKFDWKVSPLALIGLFAFSLLPYPSVRGLFLGQYVLIVFAALALAILLIGHGRDELAGVCLAVTTVKPHVVLVALAVIFAWASWQRRWRLIVSFGAALLALLIVSAMFVPTWVQEFVQALGKYHDYTHVGPPLQVLWEQLLPRDQAVSVAFGLSLLLYATLGYLCLRNLGAAWKGYVPVIELAVIVTTIAMVRTATSDQILLLIPWIHWLSDLVRCGRPRLAITVGAAVVLLPWILFLMSVSGNTESPVATTGMVSVTLVAYLIFYGRAWLFQSPRVSGQIQAGEIG